MCRPQSAPTDIEASDGQFEFCPFAQKRVFDTTRPVVIFPSADETPDSRRVELLPIEFQLVQDDRAGYSPSFIQRSKAPRSVEPRAGRSSVRYRVPETSNRRAVKHNQPAKASIRCLHLRSSFVVVASSPKATLAPRNLVAKDRLDRSTGKLNLWTFPKSRRVGDEGEGAWAAERYIRLTDLGSQLSTSPIDSSSTPNHTSHLQPL
jgi:hypothetical protein